MGLNMREGAHLAPMIYATPFVSNKQQASPKNPFLEGKKSSTLPNQGFPVL